MISNQYSLEDFLEGTTLLLDKPLGWTSFDVVNKLRVRLCRKAGVKKLKVGHAGTLDPLATGLLVICTGKHTKLITEIQDDFKVYEGTITLGATTPSYDLETEVDQTFPLDGLTEDLIRENTGRFKGEILQYPPIFSAIQKDGKRLYELARKGRTVEIEPRKLTIYDFRIDSIALPEVRFTVECSKGTYIRSLAYDFGKTLGNGGYLSRLVRTRNGNLELKNANNLDELLAYIDQL